MNKNRANRILQRATLWGAAWSLAGCMIAVPRAAAQDQDNQQVTPSQSDSQTMPPDYNNQQGAYTPQGTYNQDQQGTYNRDQQDRDAYGRDQDRDEGRGAGRRAVAEFDRFLDDHPQIAQDLARDPSLVSDRRYVDSHGDLREFLEDHHEVSERLRDNPQEFMDHVRNKQDRDSGQYSDRDRDRDRQDQQVPPPQL